MRYICFFGDDNFYYCYFENGKIFKGNNVPQDFRLRLSHFVSISLILFLGGMLNELLQYQINGFICIVAIVFGILITSIVGYQVYNRIEKKAVNNYTEVFLSKNQLKEYVLRGKKQFESHKLILLFLAIGTIMLFCFFYFTQNFLIWFLGLLMYLILVLLTMWIKPLKKAKFYKMMGKTYSTGDDTMSD